MDRTTWRNVIYWQISAQFVYRFPRVCLIHYGQLFNCFIFFRLHRDDIAVRFHFLFDTLGLFLAHNECKIRNATNPPAISQTHPHNVDARINFVCVNSFLAINHRNLFQIGSSEAFDQYPWCVYIQLGRRGISFRVPTSMQYHNDVIMPSVRDWSI